MLCAAFVSVILACACRPEQGAPYRCDCTFVTDFDADARIDVEVCSPTEARAEGVGRGCAQTHAPGPVSGCSCRSAPARGPCEPNVCRITPAAP